MPAQTTIPKVNLYKQGAHVTLPRALEIIKNGASISSMKLFDPIFQKNFSSLPVEVQREAVKNWVATKTFVVKAANGKKLGDRIVFSDGTNSVTFIVNTPFKSEYGKSRTCARAISALK